MDFSPPGSSVHRILQARILKRVAVSFSSRSSQPRDQIQVIRIAGSLFTNWATREALGIKNLPVMQKTKERRVQSLGQEDPLERRKNGNSLLYSCLGKTHGERSLVGYIHRVSRVGHDCTHLKIASDPTDWSPSSVRILSYYFWWQSKVQIVTCVSDQL